MQYEVVKQFVYNGVWYNPGDAFTVCALPFKIKAMKRKRLIVDQMEKEQTKASFATAVVVDSPDAGSVQVDASPVQSESVEVDSADDITTDSDVAKEDTESKHTAIPRRRY